MAFSLGPSSRESVHGVDKTRRDLIFSNNCLMLLLNASVTNGNRNEKDVTRGSLFFRGLFLQSTALLKVAPSI